ncbi:MAG TPA: cytochrome b/b6 domain-containing protein [Terriglobales bacterium]|nr:cytochrome b/b6 domain-containing protein [Terriglobales bacterium]
MLNGMQGATGNVRRSYLGYFVLLFSVCALFPGWLQAQPKTSHPLKQDESCLACHGQAGMTSASGNSISIDPVKHAASVHGILGCTDCHTTIKDFPHPDKVAKVQCLSCHTDEASHVAGSIHGAVGVGACQSCHGDPHEVAAAAQTAPTKCAQCHADEVKDFRQSIHGKAAAAGDPDAPNCGSCHGSVHQIQVSSDAASPVAKKNLPETCASCHSNQQFLSRHKIPFAHPVELYRQSVHGRAVADGDGAAATCSDCHGSHGILPPQDAHSKINHWNIAATCGQCHADIAKTYLASVHGQAMKSGVVAAPVCSDCHGEHLILGPKEAGSLVNAGRVSMVTCGRCHSDERLALRYNLPADRVPSYADSYHGLAARGGSQSVANCASCHGVHNIFRSSDARSTVNAANISKTCGNCHAGAGDHFVIGPVHVQTASGPAHPVVTWIRWTYWLLIPLTLGFMIAHNLIDFLSKLIRRQPRHETGAQVTRMNRNFRIAHWGVILSFPTLVFTGFALKYPEAWWARPLLLWEGHLAFRGLVHRCAAIVLLASTIYHVIHLSFINRRDGAMFLKAMFPEVRDVTDLLKVFSYNLGLTKIEPRFAKFNYAEKVEYWAFMWGTVVMTVSGFLLWFNNFTLRYFPKWVSDAATAIHYYEALLATFSILLWHFYMVIFDPLVYPMDTAWLNGKVPADHYRHTRPEYLRALERAHLVELPEDPADFVEGEKTADVPSDDAPVKT